MQLYEQDKSVRIKYTDFLANFVNLKKELTEEDMYLGKQSLQNMFILKTRESKAIFYYPNILQTTIGNSPILLRFTI